MFFVMHTCKELEKKNSIAKMEKKTIAFIKYHNYEMPTGLSIS
jgi:hypothetical protein